MQTKVSEVATAQLSSHLGVPVRIGNVDVEWFNKLVLQDLYLEDQEGHVLFEANHVAAGFEIMPLFEKKFVFTTVRLFGFSLNLRKSAPDSPLNLRFVIDAFARKDTVRRKKEIDLRFNTVLIRRGHFSYHVDSEKTTPGKFNAKHIDIKNLSAKISLKAFNKDSVNAQVKRLSFEEESGFSLEKLSLSVISNRDSAFIRDFEIRLPHTDLRIGQVHVDLSPVDSLPDLLTDAPIHLDIDPSHVCLKDLSSFVPAFRNFVDTVEFSAETNGYINNFATERLTLKYSDKMLFVGRMELKNIIHPQEAYLFGKVDKLYLSTEGISDLARNFNDHPVRLPEPIVRLGTVNFTGEISGFFDNLVAFGRLSSSIGSLQTDLIFGRDKARNIAAYLRGRIASNQLRIHELFEEGNPWGGARFDIRIDAQRPINGTFAGNIHAHVNEFDYKSYQYKDIDLSGNFKKNSFDGTIQINDPNGNLYAQGLFQHKGKNSLFNFTAKLDHFRPDQLHLTDKYERPDISLALNADFTGNNIDNLEGSIRLDSLSFNTAPDSFFLERLEVMASGHSLDRQLTIHSDILHGEVTGAYSFQTLAHSLMNTFEEYVPALAHTARKRPVTKENNFALLLTIENTEALSSTLKLPFTMIQPGRVTGHYNNIYDKFRIEAWLPKFRLGKSTFESGYLVCDNPDDKANLRLKAVHYNRKGLRNYLDLKADAKDNLVNTAIGWATNKERLFKADITAATRFIEEEKGKGTRLRTEVTLNESPLIINDTTWRISPANITVRDGKIDIRHFRVEHEGQYLTMDGLISRDPVDSLLVDLRQIELSYVFDILNIPVLQFGGKATGRFYVNDLYNSRRLNTNLEIQDFSFNDVTFGRLNLFSSWDDEQKGILMRGNIYKNDSTWTYVDGYVFPVGPKAGLSLYFDANDIDLAFLRPFVDKVVKDLSGRGFGSVHLHGPFKQLTVEGDAFVADGSLGVDYLDTYYTFSDSVHLDATSVKLRNVTLRDKFGNTGNVNLTFNHRHFKDYSFLVDLQGQNMLMYNASQKKNPLIYGTVFASGTARIQGNGRLVDFDINLQSEPNTSVYLDFINNNRAGDYDFITFVDKSKLSPTSDSIAITPIDLANNPEEGAELRMNFMLDITPDANIELIMDPVAGDRIKGNASGSLQIQYGTSSDLRMYGDVNIVEGNYNFSLQQIIRKDFKIRDGSTISFQGDPFNANMHIDAIYNLTANIGDLDQSLADESVRASVPVNCVLNLDGPLRAPTFSFDLEFPNSNEELERQVRAFVDTEDMMTRQIVYLLVLNKFYTPEYAQTKYRSSELNAVASSAISTQLSSILNSLTDKVQIGTNIRAGQDGFRDDTEYEMLLSSQLLDNRLLINGNFGVRNTINTGRNNTFIGEFDLEYKLTPSGEIRLKAYNHARDMYFGLKQALTIQGVGIMYRKDFTHFSEIFRRKRKPLLPAPADSTGTAEAVKSSVREPKKANLVR